jgi:hypothetical protein
MGQRDQNSREIPSFALCINHRVPRISFAALGWNTLRWSVALRLPLSPFVMMLY